MGEERIEIREPDAVAARASVSELADLLKDCVEGGASLGFPSPLELDVARTYWQGVAYAIEAGQHVLLVAGDPIVGTVQLRFSSYPNGRHRAEVAKLLVHSSARKRGLGTRLMERVEQEAARRGMTLLVLDTQTGSGAENLYRKLGWESAGVIPDFAFTPFGQLAPSTFFFKRLR
ncbi:MAG: GNAT family N-acetyltransferase [Candidatus Dormibacteraceae bacterium]